MSNYNSFSGRVYGFLLAIIIIAPSIYVLDIARSSGYAAFLAVILFIVLGVGLLIACFCASDQSAVKFLGYGNHWAILPITLLSIVISKLLWKVREKWRG